MSGHYPSSIKLKLYWMDNMQYVDFNHTSNINIIKNIFNHLSDQDVFYVLEKSSIKKFQKNELIIHHENNHESLYVLLDGIIQIGYLSPSGRFHAFHYYSEKNLINLFACLQNNTPEYQYYAFNQVKVLIIPKSIFLALTQKNNDLSQEVMQLLALRMHHLMAELKFLHVANLHQKVCKILLNLSLQYGVKHDLGTEITLKISQHDLADLLSASRQTVNKEIKKLVMDDVLSWQYENIIIKNNDYLVLQLYAI